MCIRDRKEAGISGLNGHRSLGGYRAVSYTHLDVYKRQVLKGMVTLKSGLSIDANAPQKPVSDDVYFIVPDKCTECKGFHEEPQCCLLYTSRCV